MLSRILGRVRGVLAGDYPENRDEEQFIIDCLGNQMTNLSLPPHTELARLGESYTALGTGVTSLIVMPSTVAQLALYNAEPGGGKSYVITQVGTVVTTSTAAVNCIGVCVQVCTTPVANPKGAIGIRSLAGRGPYPGVAAYRGKGNCTASVTVTSDAWHPVGTSVINTNSAANIMSPFIWDVQGRYIIPPGGCFGITSVGSIALTCMPFVVWHEAMLING